MSSLPYFIIDPQEAVSRYKEMETVFGKNNVFYAMKSGDDISILNALNEAGCGFDIATAGESLKLSKMDKVSPLTIFTNTTKSDDDLAYSWNYGNRIYVTDSLDDLNTIHARFKNRKLDILIRIETNNSAAGHPLSGKFGCSLEEVPRIVEQIKNYRYRFMGFSFHVGSQNPITTPWANAAEKVMSLGYNVPVLDIGGGFPVFYGDDSRDKRIEFLTNVKKKVSKYFSGRIIVEPGRYISSPSAKLYMNILRVSKRNGETFAFCDVGIFNGLLESNEPFFDPRVVSIDSKSSDMIPVRICGPTCDSDDMWRNTVLLPSDIAKGMALCVENAGSYSYVVMGRFNGIKVPNIIHR